MTTSTARDRDAVCHSLVVRAPGPIDTARAQRQLAMGRQRWPELGPLRLWETAIPARSDEPVARDRADTEASRPVRADRYPLRAVLLRYADGVVDLVLLAVRSAVSRATMRQVGALVLEGPEAVGDVPPIPSVAPTPQRPPLHERAHGGVEWGLGDPRCAGIVGSVPLDLAGPPDLDERLVVGAIALTLARYGGEEPGLLGFLTPTGGAADDIRARSVKAHEDQSAAEFLGQLDEAPPVPRDLPAVGVVLDTGRADTRYVPCLPPLFPLTLHVERQRDGSFRGTCWYDEGTVAPRIADQFRTHVGHLARQLAKGPQERPLSQLEFMTAEQTNEVLRLGGEGRASGTDGRIHEAFVRVADRQPEAEALVAGDERLTYRQLDDRAERIAAGLRALDVVPGIRVGVCLEHDADLVVTLLAVLKTGCAYVPMDVRYPAERLRFTTDNAQLSVVVTTAERFPETTGTRIVTPDELRGLAGESAAAGERTRVDGDGGDAAYVIYTSGSTGRPKGVVVPHRNVLALLEATAEDFGLDSDDTWTLFHSSAFDFSVWEIWGCLLTGGRLVVVPYWVTRDPEEFHELLADHRVTVLNQTLRPSPNWYGPICGHPTSWPCGWSSSVVSRSMCACWRHGSPSTPTRCRVVNMFGITETTVHVTAQTLTPADVAAGSRSVGRALPGWSLSVRDQQGRLLPPGPAGEIWVGGAGVAGHYLGQPQLTAERFVIDDVTGQRLYRSGDKGRLRPDGRLDHLGRLDSQVKIRGHRVELDEIRAVLLGAPQVTAAVVVVRQDSSGDPSSTRIDAFVVVAGAAGAVDTQEILAHARRALPDYMTPSTITEVEAVPLTVNGKLDASRLPELQSAPSRSAATVTAPAAAADDVLQIWNRLLNTEVGPEDNFFELGGNSLLVVRAIAEMREVNLPKVSPRQFYSNSTAAQFVRLVRQLMDSPASDGNERAR